MTKSLPTFKYHPDPIATGVIESIDIDCVCCGQSRGYIYIGPVYSIADLEDSYICPWCIADGSAAAKFNANFSDDAPLLDAGLSQSIVDEVTTRTPAYTSWQQGEWLSHCNDGCEFHGDASVKDVEKASPATKAQWMTHYKQGEKDWQWVSDGYRSGGGSALYKFICRHCGQILFGWDLS